jgi:hypothetical protein
LATTKEVYAFTVLERAFKDFGLPQAIRTDNGHPFASTTAFFGLSKLSVWWLRSGIGIEPIEPGQPQQNGRHERMHLTLKKMEATRPPGRNFLQQQDGPLQSETAWIRRPIAARKPSARIIQVRRESNRTSLRLRRLHQRADRRVDLVELTSRVGIQRGYGFLQRRELAGQFGMRGQHRPEAHKRAHHIDGHLDRPRAVQHGRRHDGAVLRKDPRETASPPTPTRF